MEQVWSKFEASLNKLKQAGSNLKESFKQLWGKFDAISKQV